MLIIETPDQKMVVDTCIGNDKNLNMEGWANLQLPFLDDLGNLGHDPDSIDTVICTHLHVDHVGWNTRKVEGRWVPTFSNARYLMVEDEFTFWRDLEEDDFGDVFGESVAPVVDAGQADLVKPDHKVSDHVWFESTPGHTPGHVSVHIASQGEEAIITGRHDSSSVSGRAAGLGHAVRRGQPESRRDAQGVSRALRGSSRARVRDAFCRSRRRPHRPRR